MLSETSGDFAAALEQPNMPPLASNVSKARNNFIVFIFFPRVGSRDWMPIGSGLKTQEKLESDSFPRAVLCRIAHFARKHAGAVKCRWFLFTMRSIVISFQCHFH